MRYVKTLLFVFFLSIFLLNNVYAQEGDLTLKSPFEDEEKTKEKNIPLQLNLSKIPHFPQNLNKPTSGNRISINSSLIPVDLRLKLVVDSFIDTKKSMNGDYFKAHVADDFYIPTDPPQLIVPKGSWVRGRISNLKKPNIFIKSGKIELHLDGLTTPVGEVALLDAQIDVQRGFLSPDSNEEGLLNLIATSVHGKKSAQKFEEDVSPLTIDSFDSKAISSLVSGFLTALSSDFDNIVLNRGQELQIVIKRDIKLAAN